jgi:hypothetical protein
VSRGSTVGIGTLQIASRIGIVPGSGPVPWWFLPVMLLVAALLVAGWVLDLVREYLAERAAESDDMPSEPGDDKITGPPGELVEQDWAAGPAEHGASHTGTPLNCDMGGG